MLRHPENSGIFVFPQLEDESLDIEQTYDLLRQVPDGVTLNIGGHLLEFLKAMDSEKEVMERSLAEKVEYGLVVVGDRQEIIRGESGQVRTSLVYQALQRLEVHQEDSLFSHSHWDIEYHPMPSRGDILNWWKIKGAYPALDCRVTFNGDKGVRAISYKGTATDFSILSMF